MSPNEQKIISGRAALASTLSTISDGRFVHRGRPHAGSVAAETGEGKPMDADAIVVGAGLAGLTAAAELADAGRRVVVVEQESHAGGQAWWSFGGLFFVDSPEQRRLRIRDSVELAWQDWQDAAGFDRPQDHWPRRWAEAYVHFAAGE